MSNLLDEIEVVRKKLNDSCKHGYDEESCYQLSVELDRLIEQYILWEKKLEDTKSEDKEPEIAEPGITTEENEGISIER